MSEFDISSLQIHHAATLGDRFVPVEGDDAVVVVLGDVFEFVVLAFYRTSLWGVRGSR